MKYFSVLLADICGNGQVGQLSLFLRFVKKQDSYRISLFHATYFNHWGSSSGLHINNVVTTWT